jgi:hypothetical protein
MNNDKSIAEINEVIAKIEAELKPECEIGARDKATLKSLLKTTGTDREVKFFTCKREHSAKIVSYFVKEKKVTQSRFSMNAQPNIFLLL